MDLLYDTPHHDMYDFFLHQPSAMEQGQLTHDQEICYSCYRIYPTKHIPQPHLRATKFGFATFHNLLVRFHLFVLGGIVSYLGLVESCVAKKASAIYFSKMKFATFLTHDSQVPFGIACRACRAFGSVVNQDAITSYQLRISSSPAAHRTHIPLA